GTGARRPRSPVAREPIPRSRRLEGDERRFEAPLWANSDPIDHERRLRAPRWLDRRRYPESPLDGEPRLLDHRPEPVDRVFAEVFGVVLDEPVPPREVALEQALLVRNADDQPASGVQNPT